MAKVLRFPTGRRAPRYPLWEPLWDELCRRGELPSPDQEAVIAEVVAEILELAQRLKMGPINDPSAWLRGFALKMKSVPWPPESSQDYNKIFGGLKRRKERLRRLQRRELSLISWPQIKRIRWLLNHDPYRDEEWLYAYIGENFPEARRQKDGRMQPSLSNLTTAEASHLIDLLQGQAPARRRRRKHLI